MANPMQQPQANDQSDAPVQPIVSGSPNETNARTGGMVSLPAWPTPQAPPTAGQYAQRLGATLGIGAPAAPSPQLAPHSRAAIGPTPADHAKVALGYVLSGETPQVRPGTPAHAAAPAQPAYEQPGYYPDASAGAPGSSGYENAWNGAHPDNQLAARGAYIPPPPGQTESQRLHEQYGIHPDDHALASHAAANPHMYSNGAFTNIFAGKPIDYVQRLVAMMQPPSMEDQARRAAVQASGQDAARNAQVSGTDAEQQSQRAGAAREGLLEEILRTIYGGYYTKPKK